VRTVSCKLGVKTEGGHRGDRSGLNWRRRCHSKCCGSHSLVVTLICAVIALIDKISMAEKAKAAGVGVGVGVTVAMVVVVDVPGCGSKLVGEDVGVGCWFKRSTIKIILG